MREYLEVEGRPFIPIWVTKEWGAGVWADHKSRLERVYSVRYSSDYHGYVCYNK